MLCLGVLGFFALIAETSSHRMLSLVIGGKVSTTTYSFMHGF